jgi:hypothetical protein
MTDPNATTVSASGTAGRGNLVLAIFGGVAAAVAGALIWMGVQILLQLHIGYVAIAIGFMVGYAIRSLGHGSSPIYGIIGAVLTLAGCLGGEILGDLYQASTAEQGFFDLLLHADYVAMVQAIFSQMGPIGYFIYGIGIFEGYKLSIAK